MVHLLDLCSRSGCARRRFREEGRRCKKVGLRFSAEGRSQAIVSQLPKVARGKLQLDLLVLDRVSIWTSRPPPQGYGAPSGQTFVPFHIRAAAKACPYSGAHPGRATISFRHPFSALASSPRYSTTREVMTIWINRAGQNVGTFSLEEVQRRLEQGQLVPTDLAWQEGMPAWKPLSELPGVRIPPPEPEGAGQAIPAVLPSESAPQAQLVAASTEPAPAWENPGGMPLTKAFFTTFRQVLFEPGPTFARLPVNGQIGRATGFYAIIIGLSLLVSVLLNLAFFPLSRSLAHANETDLGLATPTAFLPIVAVLGFFLALAWNFVASGIYHLVLMLVGGNRRGYAATYKVVSYSNAASIFTIVPCIGVLVSMVWFLIVGVTGLRRVHEIETWKAGVALLAPFLLCFAAGIGLVFFALSQAQRDLH